MDDQWVGLPLSDLQYLESVIKLAEAQPDAKPTVKEAALRALHILRRNYRYIVAPPDVVTASVPAYDSQTVIK